VLQNEKGPERHLLGREKVAPQKNLREKWVVKAPNGRRKGEVRR